MPKKKRYLSPKIGKNDLKSAKNGQNAEFFFLFKSHQYFALFSPKNIFATIVV